MHQTIFDESEHLEMEQNDSLDPNTQTHDDVMHTTMVDSGDMVQAALNSAQNTFLANTDAWHTILLEIQSENALVSSLRQQVQALSQSAQELLNS